MGYFYPYGATRASLIQQLTAANASSKASRKTLRHCTQGNVLWTVNEVTRTADGSKLLYIGCDLLRPDKEGWGYKSLTEGSHPFYYTCPLAYLDQVPPADEEWRTKVRAYWAQRTERMRQARELRARMRSHA